MRCTFVLLLALCGMVGSALANDLQVLPATVDGVAPRGMMHAYLMRLTREALDRSDRRYEEG
jgi:hypothetical protein